MTQTTITISGPGGCINNEMVLVEKILIEHGYEVEVVNDDAETSMSFEERSLFIKNNHKSRSWKVKLVANHQPWGG